MYEGYKNDIFSLKERYGLNLLVHNYFPPPVEDFVINLASLDDTIFKKSIDQLTEAIRLTKELGADKFGFHAGFFVDVHVKDLGNIFKKKYVGKKDTYIERFCEGFNELKQLSEGVELYLENNVYSYPNYQIYQNQIPFMLLNFKDYEALKCKIDFKLLLDLGHLNVTINTLGLNRNEEFDHMIQQSDYIHISDNDGLHDQNNRLNKESELYDRLKECDLWKKTVTLETYDDIDVIRKSYDVLTELLNNREV